MIYKVPSFLASWGSIGPPCPPSSHTDQPSTLWTHPSHTPTPELPLAVLSTPLTPHSQWEQKEI